ncbi:hypothetical protein [Haladaptatus salinisoli]|uniref:hypothetical protein n=1 Tax=Haladaptatus salinisoli TaxID=2884876 RepID=UPI001D0A0E53|nr:hypothetical protein [Haladaptatus salinisoli]
MGTKDAAGKVRFGLALALGVVVPGMAKYALTEMGYGSVGTVVFYTGYLTAAVLIWYIWVRPLELTGSSGA